MTIVRITETKRVENMQSNWYKVMGKDQNGKEYVVSETQLPVTLHVGEFVEGKIRYAMFYATKIVDGFEG
jgi:hypothetical protein